MKTINIAIFVVSLIASVESVEMPGSCNSNQYYDTSLLVCQPCPVNASMVASTDGFACQCVEHSVPVGVTRCKVCNASEMVSSDGRSCVPRRCQGNAGRRVCRKCPNGYIAVTQNWDGSPMKEVQCVKCARGYKASGNMCVRCEQCACAKHEQPVHDSCVPKAFVNQRGKARAEVVKMEYLCTQNDIRACRALANECVKSFYTVDVTGACRLWVQPKTTPPKGLPSLSVDLGSSENPGEITLHRGMNASLTLAIAIHTLNGELKILRDPTQEFPCHLPVKFSIGYDFTKECSMNVSRLAYPDSTIAPYLYVDDDYKPIPVTIRKPDGLYVQRGTWPISKFRRYFIRHDVPSTIPNVTSTVYLRTLVVKVRIQRDNFKNGLRVLVSIEAQYSAKSALQQMVAISLAVEHDMPSAGVLRGLEVWGGVLCAALTLLAVVQWRAVVSRGGLRAAGLALVAGAVADALYFAALFSTTHALAAEAGSLGMTLPLTASEQYMVKAFVYSAIGLKAMRLLYINMNQCTCDIFFLDWAEYDPPIKESTSANKSTKWKSHTVAREWSSMQTKRRATPWHTVTLALLFLYLTQPWQSSIPNSEVYLWAMASIAWWCAYISVLLAQWLKIRLFGSPSAVLPAICRGIGMSLLVFQEEFYAHYVDGRNDDVDIKSTAITLTTCRVACVPQLRTVYKQLTTPTMPGSSQSDMKQALLSKFLAAFFERALDGLSWVASERTLLERLFDIEVTAREGGSTSALLYHPDDAPSCFNMTWWGQEWNLGTFDALLFGGVVVSGHDSLLAALLVLVTWQTMKITRKWFGDRNLKRKTGVDVKIN